MCGFRSKGAQGEFLFEKVGDLIQSKLSILQWTCHHYPLNPQNQGGTSENVSYIFGRAPGTPKNVSWNPPRCPEWSVFEGGGGAPKNVSWNLEGYKLHFCHPPPFPEMCPSRFQTPRRRWGGENIQNGTSPRFYVQDLPKCKLHFVRCFLGKCKLHF